jgi:hypothetical protein
MGSQKKKAASTYEVRISAIAHVSEAQESTRDILCFYLQCVYFFISLHIKIRILYADKYRPGRYPC